MDTPNPLRIAFASNHPQEFAAFVATRPADELRVALSGLPAAAGAAVIAKLPHSQSVALLGSQSDQVVSSWLARAALDDALTLLLHLEEGRRETVLAGLEDRRLRRTLERLVVYPRRTVGALVDPTVVRIAADTQLKDAIATLRGGGKAPGWIWIVDADGRYRGLLDSGKALLAGTDRYRVGELAMSLQPLRAETALAVACNAEEWLKHPELPVVDHRQHLLGALSRERLVAALREEAPAEHGIADDVSSLAQSYFHVLGVCLDDLLRLRGAR